jgi:hypothetical protein
MPSNSHAAWLPLLLKLMDPGKPRQPAKVRACSFRIRIATCPRKVLLELYCDPTKPLTRRSSYVKAAKRVTALRRSVWSHKGRLIAF